MGMSKSVVTLTTDFGPSSTYVAAMKGVMLSINPTLNILDLSHSIPPQNLQIASFFLRNTISYYPQQTIHVVVVDPGVGSKRDILLVEMDDQSLIVPDNGVCSSMFLSAGSLKIYRLNNPKYWRANVSATFHGRDIFAPVAAHLSKGIAPNELGVLTDSYVKLAEAIPIQSDQKVTGEIVYIDDFGNILTNIPSNLLRSSVSETKRVRFGETTLSKFASHYAEVGKGELVALISSFDTLEIAINHGNAAKVLHAEIGAKVDVLFG